MIKNVNNWILDNNEKIIGSENCAHDHERIVVQGDGFEVHQCIECGFMGKHYVDREQISMADGMMPWS